MEKVLGLVNLHTNINFGGLTKRRPVASVNFLGRYSVIDFVLSNMTNSNIDKIGILVQEKPRSLFKYLGQGNPWTFNSKVGGLTMLYNEKYANNSHYNHDINNMLENLTFLKKSKAQYVVIAPAHILTTINYRDVIAMHEKKGSTITVVYKEIEQCSHNFIGEQCLDINNNRVIKTRPNHGIQEKENISLQSYVINLETLIEIIEKASQTSTFFSLCEYMNYLVSDKVIDTYRYDGYVACLNSIQSYYQTSLQLLDTDVYRNVFNQKWPVYTHTNDTPPSKYLPHAKITKTLVANGAVIDGVVENSIVGRNVVIEAGAKVKNSILLCDCIISKDTYLENVVIDKEAKVMHCKKLIGYHDDPMYVRKGDII